MPSRTFRTASDLPPRRHLVIQWGHGGGWIAENWFNILSAVGIVGSLLFTAISLRSETKTRQVGNLLILTKNYRELWAELFDRPALRRVLDASVDLLSEPITLDESFYINMLIQHLGSAFQAMRSGLTIKPEGLKQDVREFFSLPIPHAIWEKIKVLQNDEFVDFVETCLESDGAEEVALSWV